MKLRPKLSFSGFTLIEVLVMTSLVIIILLSSVIVFMTFLLNQNRITQRQKIKTEGDNALKQITQILREAKRANCEDQPALNFTTLDNNVFSLTTNDDDQLVITSSDGGVADLFLTSQDLTVDTLSIECIQGGEDLAMVKVEFELTNETAHRFTPQVTKQKFSTSITLRN